MEEEMQDDNVDEAKGEEGAMKDGFSILKTGIAEAPSCLATQYIVKV